MGNKLQEMRCPCIHYSSNPRGSHNSFVKHLREFLCSLGLLGKSRNISIHCLTFNEQFVPDRHPASGVRRWVGRSGASDAVIPLELAGQSEHHCCFPPATQRECHQKPGRGAEQSQGCAMRRARTTSNTALGDPRRGWPPAPEGGAGSGCEHSGPEEMHFLRETGQAYTSVHNPISPSEKTRCENPPCSPPHLPGQHSRPLFGRPKDKTNPKRRKGRDSWNKSQH